ncbi:MAG: hypothetical protein KBC38_02390 [Candidatus Pacebacteria bacterium]|nr:hypothetical protein [Candidatus Paceibacterota bacterium]MBP9840626.1 hypothetical protein [Candidatus Paceibacterota bacterium]
MVHIVQRRRKTVSYGATQSAGNVYYRWPRWVPLIGVTSTHFPVSNFDLHLTQYKSYDKDRLPFEIDVTAFFRIKDTNQAAERVADFKSLHHQLMSVVQGAVRKILASNDIHQIMVDRATFGQQFTDEVKKELENWGVEPVKNIELMDIRDADGSQVIANIMAKKSSHINMESRVEVAKNGQAAQTAEIEAKQAVDVRTQEAEQFVGTRTAEKDKLVGIANQEAKQAVTAQEAITREKEMEVIRVGQVKQAEITRDSAVVAADQTKQTTVITAQGNLDAAKLHAEGVKVEGEAVGAADTAKFMAPVTAQMTLAKEIGNNNGYQDYLVRVELVKANQVVGVAQAEALKAADIKVIANAGAMDTGLTSIGSLLSSAGGTALGSLLEGLKNTPTGAAVLNTMGVGESEAKEEAPATPPVAIATNGAGADPAPRTA